MQTSRRVWKILMRSHWPEHKAALLEGTYQGGPLSPLLSNILLTDLDRELERRGHRFCRYADDCNIYVRSQRSGHRVLDSITNYLGDTLKLKVNQEKSGVGRPWERKFLGYPARSGWLDTPTYTEDLLAAVETCIHTSETFDAVGAW